MPRNTQYAIETDVRKALNDIQNLTTKFKEMEVQIGNVAKRSEAARVKGDGLTTSFKGTAAAIGGMAASVLTLDQALAVFTKYEQHLDRIKQKSDEAARGVKPLAVQMAGLGLPYADLRTIEQMGARAGLDSATTGTIANTVKSIQGSSMKRDFPVAAILANMGVAPDAAASIVQAGVVRGIGSGRAADLVLGASDLAPIDVPGMANALPGTLQFSSLETGLAAAAALRTGGLPTEQLPTALKAAAKILRKDETLLAKKFKLQGLGETERILKLREAAEASGDVGKFASQAFMSEKFKLGDEEAQALGILIQNAGKFRESESTLRKTAPLSTAMRFKTLLDTNPEFRSEYESRVGTESLSLLQRDTQGDAARKTDAALRARGLQFTREHPFAAGFMVDNGKPNLLLRASDWLFQNTGGGDERPSMQAMRAEARANAQDPEGWLRRESALATDPDNTKATDRNTQALERLESTLAELAGKYKTADRPRDRNAGL